MEVHYFTEAALAGLLLLHILLSHRREILADRRRTELEIFALAKTFAQADTAIAERDKTGPEVVAEVLQREAGIRASLFSAVGSLRRFPWLGKKAG